MRQYWRLLGALGQHAVDSTKVNYHRCPHTASAGISMTQNIGISLVDDLHRLWALPYANNGGFPSRTTP